MARSPRKADATEAILALRALLEGDLGETEMQRLRQSLEGAEYRVVAAAAEVAQARGLRALRPHIRQAFERFRRLPAKSDPGCVAKLALVDALDFLDESDPAPFLHALRTFQLEPVWGGSTDTAENVRARGVRALANLGYADIVLVAGECMADRATVRMAAAEALAHSGARAGAGVLRLALATRDEPQVRLACMAALLALAPDFGLPYLRTLLDDPLTADDSTLVVTTLGESGRDDALETLHQRLEASVVATERAEILRAVALHRSDRALHLLGEIVRDARTVDAVAAISALAPRRADERVARMVKAAVDRRGEPAVAAAFAQSFEVEKD